jgi:hypothetical protein
VRRQFTGVAIFRFEYAQFVEGGTCDPVSFDYADAPYEISIDAKIQRSLARSASSACSAPRGAPR